MYQLSDHRNVVLVAKECRIENTEIFRYLPYLIPANALKCNRQSRAERKAAVGWNREGILEIDGSLVFVDVYGELQQISGNQGHCVVGNFCHCVHFVCEHAGALAGSLDSTVWVAEANGLVCRFRRDGRSSEAQTVTVYPNFLGRKISYGQ